MLAQQILSGLAAGCLYAFAALGLVLIYKTSTVVNFAHGDLATLSAFLAFTAIQTFGLPLLAAFPLALLCAALLGAGLAFAIMRRVKATGLGLTIVTLGISMILYGGAGWLWGYDTKAFPAVLSGPPFELGGLVVSLPTAALFLLAIVLVLALYVVFNRTLLGRAMRAAAENPLAARLVGISVDRVLVYAWAASSFLGALCGLLIAPMTFLDPNMMADVLVKAFAAAVLGGLTSLPGAVVGGLLLGVIENLVGAYLATELRSTLAFGVIIAVLILRPSGLFGRSRWSSL